MNKKKQLISFKTKKEAARRVKLTKDFYGDKAKNFQIHKDDNENYIVSFTLEENNKFEKIKTLKLKDLLKEEKYKLDQNFIKAIKPGLLSLWGEIGHDISDTTNKNIEAIEALIDQLSSHIDGKDSRIRKEAEKILTQVLSNYGYDKGLKFIAQNINLI